LLPEQAHGNKVSYFEYSVFFADTGIGREILLPVFRELTLDWQGERPGFSGSRGNARSSGFSYLLAQGEREDVELFKDYADHPDVNIRDITLRKARLLEERLDKKEKSDESPEATLAGTRPEDRERPTAPDGVRPIRDGGSQAWPWPAAALAAILAGGAAWMVLKKR